MLRRKTRRVEDAAYWRAHADQWQQSGQTLTAYVQAHGLCRSTFRRWRRKLESSAPEQAAAAPKASAPRLARVEVVRSAAPASRCRLELPNGIGIEWSGEGSAEQLGVVLEACRRWG